MLDKDVFELIDKYIVCTVDSIADPMGQILFVQHTMFICSHKAPPSRNLLQFGGRKITNQLPSNLLKNDSHLICKCVSEFYVVAPRD